MEHRRLNTGKSCNYIAVEYIQGDERVKEHQGHVQGIGCKGGCATPRAFVVRRFAIKDFATLVLLYKITSRGL